MVGDVEFHKACTAKGWEMILSEEQGRHADWFREGESVLELLHETRNKLYLKWLNSRQESEVLYG